MLPTTEVTAAADKNTVGMLAGLGMLFGLLYFVQGIVEPTDGLLSQPTKSLLRQWEHSAASAAWFATILSLPWAIKPLYGLLTDFVPLAGSYRRSHLLVTTAVACAGLSALYFLPLGSDRGTLLLTLLLLPAVAIAYSDVVTDALMIEVGQPRGLTGRLQSIQWASIYAATIFTGVTGGALSQSGLQQLGFLIAGVSCAISFVAVWLLVREPDRASAVPCTSLLGSSGPCAVVKFRLGRALSEMGQTFREPGVLTIGVFLFFWNFNPFSSTVLYYYSTTNLHFSEQFVGTLTSWQAVGGVVGSILYGVFCRAMPVPWLNPRLDCYGYPGHAGLLGIPRSRQRRAGQCAGGLGVRHRIAGAAGSGGSGVSTGDGGNDLCAADVVVEPEPVPIPGRWRVDVRGHGTTMGTCMGIPTAGR